MIQKQQEIPKLEKSEYSINYHIAMNDTYLQALTIKNENPSSYSSSKGLTLMNLSEPEGYQFEPEFRDGLLQSRSGAKRQRR